MVITYSYLFERKKKIKPSLGNQTEERRPSVLFLGRARLNDYGMVMELDKT